MAEKEVEGFLTHLAVDLNVAASTQNQALNAIVFLYTKVLLSPLPADMEIIWAKKPKRAPVVLSTKEAAQLINALSGITKLMAQLLYGSGLRLMECLRLRIKDVDFDLNQIVVRAGKGDKNRITTLPDKIEEELKLQIEKVRIQQQQDINQGFGTVYLPNTLAQKYLNANKVLGWQYLFSAPKFSVDPRSAVKQRHHYSESNLQRNIKAAAKKPGIIKPVTPHTLCYSFVTNLHNFYLNRLIYCLDFCRNNSRFITQFSVGGRKGNIFLPYRPKFPFLGSTVKSIGKLLMVMNIIQFTN